MDRDVIQKLKPAGYPQLNQVQHTAFNRSELLNLNVQSISANDLIWVANKTNNDWDVLRVTNAGIKISEIKTINNATQIEITFTGSHGLNIGTLTSVPDYFAIRNSEETNDEIII